MNFKVKRFLFYLILFFIGLASVVLFRWLTVNKSRTLVAPTPSIVPAPFLNENLLPTPPLSQGIVNFLLLGQGDPSHEGSQLTDSMMIIRLDIQEKQAALVSVPRDTWINGKKINASYVTGLQTGGQSQGFNSVKQAVTAVIGLPINNLIFIDFNGFAQTIDALGGVDVNIPKAFDDYFYPIRGRELDNCNKSPEELSSINATMSGFQLEKQYLCRYEHLHFEAKKTRMNGETALKFVRSRHSDVAGGDFNRADRQQALIIGVKDKLLSLDGLKKAPEFFNRLKNLVKTDLDLEAVKTIAGMIIDPEKYSIIKVVLSTDNVFNSSTGPGGQYILVPKAGENQWAEIQKYVADQISISPQLPQSP